MREALYAIARSIGRLRDNDDLGMASNMTALVSDHGQPWTDPDGPAGFVSQTISLSV